MLPRSYTDLSVSQRLAINRFLRQRDEGSKYIDDVGRKLYFNLPPKDRGMVALYVLKKPTAFDTFEAPKMVYQRPNGGKRTLPSVYTRLTNQWLRSTGVYVDPEEMDSNHIKNCIALLEESHGNITERANVMLGKVFAHYQNDRAIGKKLIDAAKMMQPVTVEQMYPIYRVLKKELEARPESYVFNVSSFDDALSDWMDK